MLEGDCVVHHSPWAGDGGSLDTRYIIQCLPLLLSSSVYEPAHYDAIIFNAGLHDVDCCNFSKEVNEPGGGIITVFIGIRKSDNSTVLESSRTSKITFKSK